ncbi:heavy metal translocating P-type ATPase [Moritella sp. Urea-trap-13]|uniref:heavy metal translocating P-type ATPase n=1 Tax=Moritella sp. Urea-trap-13 TaxID=2058327 RepID=UPI000C31E29A|nr:heavy metal translocating P-type ATPase [Moritella sp. Urea-trap-13]PKH09072.1 copper-translocating P-type ATPase [Moritella sp. Urea-trap-13]
MSKTLSIGIEGMSCAGCASKLESALNSENGIEARVNFALNTAQVNIADITSSHAVKAVLDDKNYTYHTEELSLSISGWSCANCAAKTVSKLLMNEDILTVEANFASEKITLTYFSGGVVPADIMNVIINLGYQATVNQGSVVSQTENLLARAAELKRQNKQQLLFVIISAFLTLPLLAGMLTMFIDDISLMVPVWLQLSLATPVQFIIGRRYYLGAYKSLKNSAANMDVLVATGTSAAYFYSLYLFLTFGEAVQGLVYFEASAVVITLISLGKYLEENAKQSTSSAIYELMMLRPEVAHVKRAGEWLTLPIEEVVIGDEVRVLAGEKVPVDGIIIDGKSELDESMITGESLPVVKNIGEALIGGSINGTGVLLLRVNAVGKDSSLNKIISLVETAQMAKAPFQQLVDKISNIFVPVVLVIATLTFLVWYLGFGDFENGLIAAVAVLVIACPCALGLATPAALVTGTGAAARQGILIKDIDTLQKAHKITDVMLDKTGTLTQGKPQVIAVHSFEYDTDTLIRSAAAVQEFSEHPLAKSIISYAKDKQLKLLAASQVETIIGYGIKGNIAEENIFIGNKELMLAENIDTQDGDSLLAKSRGHVGSQMWVAINGHLVGLFIIADTLRAESRAAIKLLQRDSIDTTILSGDNEIAVETIAQALHVDNYYAHVKPEHKSNYIKDRQQLGKFVAMVGDGINDAPALAQADISIAMGSGSDVAMETANITLLRNDPRLVSAAMDVSKLTWRKIQQNLFWAFIFNVIGLPLAAMGYLSPELAGAAMAFSSIAVLSNSLLIKRWKPKF